MQCFVDDSEHRVLSASERFVSKNLAGHSVSARSASPLASMAYMREALAPFGPFSSSRAYSTVRPSMSRISKPATCGTRRASGQLPCTMRT
eukprot:scaffold83945_cov67-Phaeocystis_antarctica.AAC.4